MSVNTANTPDGRGVLIYNGEVIIIFCTGVTMGFSKSSTPGLDGKRGGTLYLTSHRIIFLPDASSHWLKSFEMPFSNMQEVHLEQPIFGANYLRGIALPMQGSQLQGEVKWTLTFNKGGCIDYGHKLLEAVDRADRYRPANAPPPYVPPAGDYYAAPPMYYEPTNQGHNGFVAPPNFSARPDPNMVFMQEAPPPYPGIGPDRAPAPTEELVVAGRTTAPPPYGWNADGSSAEGLRQRRQ